MDLMKSASSTSGLAKRSSSGEITPELARAPMVTYQESKTSKDPAPDWTSKVAFCCRSS